MVRASHFCTDNAAELLKLAIDFLQNRAEDYLLVVPELLELRRECQNFRNIISDDVLQETENKVRRYQEQERMRTVESGEHQMQHTTNKAVTEAHFHQECQYNNSPTPQVRVTESNSDNDNVSSSSSSKSADGIRNKWLGRLSRKSSTRSVRESSRSFRNSVRSLFGFSRRGQHWSERQQRDQEEQQEQRQTQLYELKGQDAIIWDILERINTSNEVIDEFLVKEKQHRSLDQKLTWHVVDRPFQAKALREYCRTETDFIRIRLNDLSLCLQFKNNLNTPKIEDFREQMTDESYHFWSSYFKSKIHASWKEFIDAYELLYGTLGYLDKGYVKRVLVSDQTQTEGKLTIYGFIGFTSNHGFPFPKGIARKIVNIEPEEISEEKRMKLTEMTMDLVEKFSDKEMRNHLVTIYIWFSGCKKGTKEVENRADEWGRIMKKKRMLMSDKELSKEQKSKELEECKDIFEEAEQVDLARRAVYFFYERFMVMWRVGEVSRDVLKDIDFPGKGRIKDFLNYVAPLDHANYYVVMGNETNEQDKKRDYTPEIYDFMDEYLEILESQSEERQERKQARKNRRLQREKDRKERLDKCNQGQQEIISESSKEPPTR